MPAMPWKPQAFVTRQSAVESMWVPVEIVRGRKRGPACATVQVSVKAGTEKSPLALSPQQRTIEVLWKSLRGWMSTSLRL